jgi:alginate O-acetyltransferase complex protein AlgI
VIFASKAFFIFLPVVLAVYHLSGRRSRKYTFLLAASWLFYAWIPPHYLWVILLLSVIDYVAGLRIERSDDTRTRRFWLTASVVSNLGLLVAFKYTGVLYDNAASLAQWLGVPLADRVWHVVLPLGISYHTFQGISYTIDVYRRQIRAVHNFRDYALFVAFFPQLAAGPIVRAVEFLPQMVTPPHVTARQVSDGIALFAFGLFKKLVIADNLDHLFVSPVFESPSAYDDATHRWAAVAWAVQIYCDFSGYTDMALGTAKFFGFELPPNFRLPYLATSIADFWRRWHMSLSSWLRDYLYFPLGGSRHGPARTYFNLMLVFVLCGLWHGAAWNWLVYGAFNGVLMSLHRAYDRAATGVPWADALRATAGWKVVAWVGTAYQFLIGLILVRMVDWDGGLLMMRSLAGVGHAAGPESSPGFTAWGSLGVPLVVPLLIALGLSGHVVGLLRAIGLPIPERPPDPLRMIAAAVAVAGVVVFSHGVAKTFIYIQF